MTRFFAAFFALLLLTCGANAAIGVPTTLGQIQNTVGASSITITTTGAIVAGNLVVVACYVGVTSAISSVSDGTNNYTEWANGNLGGLDIWFVSNASAVSTSASLTINLSNSGPYYICDAMQVSGASTEDTGSENFNNHTSAQPTVTSNALATASEIVLGWQVSTSTNGGLTRTESSGFSNFYSTQSTLVGGSHFYSSFSYEIVSATTAVTYHPAYSSIPSAYVASIGAFEAGGPPPATECNRMLLGVGC